MRILFLIIGLLLVPLFPVQASQVRPLNLVQLSARADRIFHGRCLAVREGIDEHGLAAREIDFEVLETFKGDLPAVVTIKQFGHASSYRAPADFAVGEEVVLFLYPDSALGFTSPIGLGQGKFVLRSGAKGLREAVNQWDNAFLGGLLQWDEFRETLRRLGTR